MAIVFTKPINELKLRPAYNNDVLRFYSNSTAGQAMYATIIGPGGLNVTLYPDPGGYFFFNLKPFMTSLINTKDFEDTLTTDLEVINPDSFIYDYSDGTFRLQSINVRIYLDDEAGTIEAQGFNLSFLAGAMQLDEYYFLRKDSFYALLPFKERTADRWFVKYWEGYPFDISFYVLPEQSLKLENTTTDFEQVFTNDESYVKRLVFSDGRTDEVLEDIIPIANGFNEFTLSTIVDDEQVGADKYLLLYKVPVTCGVYLKWFNAQGGYSYWLFEETAAVDRSSKSLGELDRDNANLEDTFNRSINIGQQSQDTLKVVAELLSEDERRILEGIIDSPKIYLFTGEPYSQNEYTNWIEITLKTNSVRVQNYKEKLTNMALDFELPLRYTQTL